MRCEINYSEIFHESPMLSAVDESMPTDLRVGEVAEYTLFGNPSLVGYAGNVRYYEDLSSNMNLGLDGEMHA
jgi:hypothetical protein